MTVVELVLDASALIRGLLRESDDATKIVERIDDGSAVAHAPDLIGPETTSALLRFVRADLLTEMTAAAMIDAAGALRLVRHPSADFMRFALHRAITDGVSVYDAFYLVLASVLDAPLVTADRKLASAARNAILVG